MKRVIVYHVIPYRNYCDCCCQNWIKSIIKTLSLDLNLTWNQQKKKNRKKRWKTFWIKRKVPSAATFQVGLTDIVHFSTINFYLALFSRQKLYVKMYSKYDFNFESFVIYIWMGQFYMKPDCCVPLLHLCFIYENVACVCSLDAGVHPRTHAHTHAPLPAFSLCILRKEGRWSGPQKVGPLLQTTWPVLWTHRLATCSQCPEW